ncbi:hypothetical protein H4582DRAFT_294075 [Lactarius indigo]|nr:hypothetical protein H4582DRAFT_294075 [Lactarius indigo]
MWSHDRRFVVVGTSVRFRPTALPSGLCNALLTTFFFSSPDVAARRCRPWCLVAMCCTALLRVWYSPQIEHCYCVVTESFASRNCFSRRIFVDLDVSVRGFASCFALHSRDRFSPSSGVHLSNFGRDLFRRHLLGRAFANLISWSFILKASSFLSTLFVCRYFFSSVVSWGS